MSVSTYVEIAHALHDAGQRVVNDKPGAISDLEDLLFEPSLTSLIRAKINIMLYRLTADDDLDRAEAFFDEAYECVRSLDIYVDPIVKCDVQVCLSDLNKRRETHVNLISSDYPDVANDEELPTPRPDPIMPLRITYPDRHAQMERARLEDARDMLGPAWTSEATQSQDPERAHNVSAHAEQVRLALAREMLGPAWTSEATQSEDGR
jgi:hypothetical protein